MTRWNVNRTKEVGGAVVLTVNKTGNAARLEMENTKTILVVLTVNVLNIGHRWVEIIRTWFVRSMMHLDVDVWCKLFDFIVPLTNDGVGRTDDSGFYFVQLFFQIIFTHCSTNLVIKYVDLFFDLISVRVVCLCSRIKTFCRQWNCWLFKCCNRHAFVGSWIGQYKCNANKCFAHADFRCLWLKKKRRREQIVNC